MDTYADDLAELIEYLELKDAILVGHSTGGGVVTRYIGQEDGTLSARYHSEAVKEKRDPSGIFYYWNGERPLHSNAPQLWGTGEIRLESADRASGYW